MWLHGVVSLRASRSTLNILDENRFAGSLLVMTGTAPLWLRGDVIGEGLVAHFLLLAFWAMIVVGVPLCFGAVAGALGAMYWKRQS